MPSSGRASIPVLLASALLLIGCPNGAGITCPAGQSLCNDTCVFVASDPANCGACGTSCPGSLACINGSCGCPAGLADCADVCVDEDDDLVCAE